MSQDTPLILKQCPKLYISFKKIKKQKQSDARNKPTSQASTDQKQE